MSDDKRIIFVTGGQRSGKSLYAERLALSLIERPVYIATAPVSDDDFRRRVEIHKQRRGDRWVTMEEPIDVGRLPLSAEDVAVLDCVTLWATNCFFRFNEDIVQALDFMKQHTDMMRESGATVIMVSNEVGLGGVSPNAMQRHFADLQGSINQYIAALADEAHLIVSGIDVKIK